MGINKMSDDKNEKKILSGAGEGSFNVNIGWNKDGNEMDTSASSNASYSYTLEPIELGTGKLHINDVSATVSTVYEEKDAVHVDGDVHGHAAESAGRQELSTGYNLMFVQPIGDADGHSSDISVGTALMTSSSYYGDNLYSGADNSDKMGLSYNYT